MQHLQDGWNVPRGDSAGGLSSVPLEFLHAELQRRQDAQAKPACGSSGKHGDYNTGIHVFALFLILLLSTLGMLGLSPGEVLEEPVLTLDRLTACSFPVIARRFPKLPIPHRFLFLSRHFGTGVLIATAFIHLLPTAFISMTDPCLPDFWNKDYPPMAGFIAMISVFAVVTIEMFFASRGAAHTHSTEWDRIPDDEPKLGGVSHGGGRASSSRENGHVALRRLDTRAPDPSPIVPYSDGTPKPRNSTSSDSDLEDLEALDPISDESAALARPRLHKPGDGAGHDGAHDDSQDPHKLFLQCLLLEAGILFHSVFIGMAVSVAEGTQFAVLLIAICFHQTFEGFALGSRIAALIPRLFDASSPKPWLMALAYGATTPIGQAIGIFMHRLYDPASQTGLLMVGITNAVSSGLLLFAGLVQLIAEDFLSDRSYQTLTGRRRVEASLAVALGGLLMAVVGAFA